MPALPAGLGANSMPNIFVSYRRDDSSTISEWINEKLTGRYGAASVFKDIDSIEVAEDFPKAIGRALRYCDAMIAIIGPRWLGPESDGTRRIDRDQDWVRREIETALQLGIPVIPVLVEHGVMPPSQTLPEGMRDLTRVNALTMEVGPDFDNQVARLITAIDRIDPAPGRTSQRPAELVPQVPQPSPVGRVWFFNSSAPLWTRITVGVVLAAAFAAMADAGIGIFGKIETPLCRLGISLPWCSFGPPTDTPPASPETDATRVHSFDFQTPPGEFKSGIRKWTRVAPGVWEQLYPDGAKSYSYVVKRISLYDCDGTVVSPREEPDFQSFFPDKNCQTKQFMFRRLSQGNTWHSYVPIDHME